MSKPTDLMHVEPSPSPNETAATVPVRDGEGRFLPGNQLARGHGGSAHDLARWRRLALDATTEQDMLDVWRTLVACAKAGEPWAVHEFLDRTHGKAAEPGPEPREGLAELMRQEHERWLRPALEVHGEELAELRAENDRLRAAAASASFSDASDSDSWPPAGLTIGDIVCDADDV